MGRRFDRYRGRKNIPRNDIYLVLVADDRSKRKGGLYTQTANKIKEYMDTNLNIKETFIYDWDKIYHSDFYKKNKSLLEYVNPDINGRMYKPYAILETLKKVKYNDFVIYNDCSPEHWNTLDKIDKNEIDLNIIKDLCMKNNNILSIKNFDGVINSGWRGGDGKHTHRRMTTTHCIKKMKCEKYVDSLQHASGMFVIRKTEDTINFLEEWLHYNTIEECCSISNIKLIEEKSEIKNGIFKERIGSGENDCFYWTESLKLNPMLHGHRHDQSISGLLINKRNGSLVFPQNTVKYGYFNFLEYCRKNQKYDFINSNNH